MQSLIKARDDLERRESKDMIETIYRKAEEEQFPERKYSLQFFSNVFTDTSLADPPTIMSRIN